MRPSHAAFASALAMLVAVPGATSAASSPAAAGRIAFAYSGGQVAGGLHIVITTPGGRELRSQKLPFSDWIGYLAWSPDTEQIAFFAGRSKGWMMVPSGSVWSLRIADGALHRLARNGTQPSWSPDGRTIAYARQSGIWLMNADGSNKRLLISGGSSPAWSPDGKEIAFVRPALTNIFVMDKDGTHQRQLTHDRFYDNDPGWSPNSAKIAYIRGTTPGDTADTQLVTVNADGSGTKLVWGNRKQTSDRRGAHHPSWSPDGKRLVFYISEADAIAIIDANGNRLRLLPHFTLNSTWPSWSPR